MCRADGAVQSLSFQAGGLEDGLGQGVKSFIRGHSRPAGHDAAPLLEGDLQAAAHRLDRLARSLEIDAWVEMDGHGHVCRGNCAGIEVEVFQGWEVLLRR